MLGNQDEYLILRMLLREMREDIGWRQQDLADQLGRPQSFVSKYETGERRLDLLETRAICHACGIPLRELVRRLEQRLGD